MGMLKLTWLYYYQNSKGKTGGWSESWYMARDFDAASVAVDMRNIVNKRCEMLPVAARCIGYRITDLDADPLQAGQGLKSRTVLEESIGSFGGNDHDSNKADIPQMAVSCKVDGNAVKNVKRYLLKCVPDPVVQKGSLMDDPAFKGGFTAYERMLVQRGIAFRCIDLSEPQVGIKSISAEGAFELVSDMVFEAGQYITLNRVKSTTGKSISGTFRVNTKLTARTGTFLGWKGLTVGQSGKVRRRKWAYPGLKADSNEMIEVTVGKIGRPLKQYRGRRTAKR